MIVFVGCTNPTIDIEQESEGNFDKDTGTTLGKKENLTFPGTPMEGALPLEEIKGDIRHIYYAGEGRILISAKKLYLYDLATESILTEASHESAEIEQAWMIDNGFVLIQRVESDSDGLTELDLNYQGIFYNEELEPVSNFDFNQLLEDDDFLVSLKQISFNDDGTIMAYTTDLGLYLYDFELEKKTEVLDLSSENSEERSDIVALEQIGFTNDGTQIAFKAETLPIDFDQASYDTFGIVNIDGSNLSNQTFEDYTCKELIPYNDLLLLAEDPTNVSGRLMIMESGTNEVSIHSLTETKESGIIAGSEKGAYFASFCSTDYDYTIRIYETKTGKRVAELQGSVDDEALLYQIPVIKILDDTKTVILLLGSKIEEIETEMIIDHF